MTMLLQCAQILLEAERLAHPIELSENLSDLDAGYAVQALAASLRCANGGSAVGYKIGLTNSIAQRVYGSKEPISGVLFKAMQFENKNRISSAKFIAPKIEVELAFILKRDLSGLACSLTEVLDAIDYAVPALEIIDSRFSKAPRIAQIIADNAGAAGFVLGAKKNKPGTRDWGSITAVMMRNDIPECSGVTSSVLGCPALAVVWLAKHLAKQQTILRAGDIILSGAFIGPLPVRTGDSIKADFGRFGDVSITV